jgi:hypothetical protein
LCKEKAGMPGRFLKKCDEEALKRHARTVLETEAK